MGYKPTRDFFVVLQPDSGAPVTFWVTATTEKKARARAKRFYGDPAQVVETTLIPHPAAYHPTDSRARVRIGGHP